MNEVYININDIGEYYIKRYLEEKWKKDLISVDELIGTIEDLTGEVEELERRIKLLEDNDIDWLD